MHIRKTGLLAVPCLSAVLFMGSCSGGSEVEQTSSSKVLATTTAGPTTTYDVEGVMDDVREGVVQLVMELDGIDRESAEVRADALMEQGVDADAVDQQFALFSNWMDNYSAHPVLGRHWDEDEAQCAIVTMMRVEGITRSGSLMNGATIGGMDAEDAVALVQPVAYCTNLLAMMRVDMRDLGVPEKQLDCLLADVGEEEVASWFVAQFTHGREGFNSAMGEDLDLTCSTDS